MQIFHTLFPLLSPFEQGTVTFVVGLQFGKQSLFYFIRFQLENWWTIEYFVYVCVTSLGGSCRFFRNL